MWWTASGLLNVEFGRSMSPPRGRGAWSGTATASNVPLRLFEVNMRIHVYAPDHPKTEQFRSIFSESVSSHYTGWSDEYDQHFADRTVCFGLSNHPDDKPRAMCRVICKKYGPAVGRLPMETGDASACPASGGRRIVEASGFWFDKGMKDEGIYLIYGVFGWARMHAVDRGYLIYDPLHKTTEHIYTKQFKFRPLPAERVVYSSFKRRSTGEPVEWRVAAAGSRDFKRAQRSLETEGPTPRQIWVLNELGGWVPRDLPPH
jgi:hypothetical protein